MKLTRIMSTLALTAILGTSALACTQPATSALTTTMPTATTAVTTAPVAVAPTPPASTPEPISATKEAAQLEEKAFTFTTVDFPGANSTMARGIDAAGNIVGQYTDMSNVTHGFTFMKGKFNSIDYPGELRSSFATAISPTGDIVGQYQLKSEPATVTHGYLLTKKGVWTSVDYPAGNPLMTGPYRILADGTIVGCVHTDPLPMGMHGFVIGTQGPQSLSLLGQPASMHMGATPDGKTIVGYYTAANSTGGYGTGAPTRGYVLDNGNFIPFDVPGSKLTQAMDINAARLTAGLYTDQAGKTHGFTVDTHSSVIAGWQFTAIDYPDATLTRVFGINDSGDLVGIYIDAAGKTHGYLASHNTQN